MLAYFLQKILGKRGMMILRWKIMLLAAVTFSMLANRIKSSDQTLICLSSGPTDLQGPPRRTRRTQAYEFAPSSESQNNSLYKKKYIERRHLAKIPHDPLCIALERSHFIALQASMRFLRKRCRIHLLAIHDNFVMQVRSASQASASNWT